MRPECLYALFAPLTSLAGVGSRFAKLYTGLCGDKIIDLLYHLPIAIINRKQKQSISLAIPGEITTLKVTVSEHIIPPSPKVPYRVLCKDNTGEISLVFFHAYKDYLQKTLPLNTNKIISGKIEFFSGKLQMTHPDYILSENQIDQIPKIEPIYPLTAGISAKIILKHLNEALSKIPILPEWLDENLKKRENWPNWNIAIKNLHKPKSINDTSLNNPSRRRLAYDELLANQLALALTRNAHKKAPGREIKGDGKLQQKILSYLPFNLTNAQKRVINEIANDMAAKSQMLRLVQGDVGCGKTIVALMAMLNAVECKTQAALMAPTDILARQHFSSLKPLAEAAEVKIALLTGKDKTKDKAKTMADLANGKINIIIGTHALFQNNVSFKDLSLIVIDEQHRFGVHQRLNLTKKGYLPDVLVMTATPIPRTLALTMYGDMDISKIDEMPPSRKPVETTIISNTKINKVLDAVKRAINSNAKVYWVCPLIEESHLSDMAAAEERYVLLNSLFPNKTGLIHGKLPPIEKDRVMNDFANGNLKILVATTVIEVGVNVPDASIMIIEHAERFGLAQLHQLRGRVGRGNTKSNCLLIYSPPLSETAKARLNIMRQTDNGFEIAEEDLKLRGAGEILGTKQSGMPEFKIADLNNHADLLAIARKDAAMIVHNNPNLLDTRGKALRTLLYLFSEDEVFRTIRSG